MVQKSELPQIKLIPNDYGSFSTEDIATSNLRLTAGVETHRDAMPFKMRAAINYSPEQLSIIKRENQVERAVNKIARSRSIRVPFNIDIPQLTADLFDDLSLDSDEHWDSQTVILVLEYLEDRLLNG